MLAAAFEAWWFWLLLACALGVMALLAGSGAIATLTATGTHHHALSRRQRRLGRWVFLAGIAGAPAFALGALVASGVAVWRILG